MRLKCVTKQQFVTVLQNFLLLYYLQTWTRAGVTEQSTGVCLSYFLFIFLVTRVRLGRPQLTVA